MCSALLVVFSHRHHTSVGAGCVEGGPPVRSPTGRLRRPWKRHRLQVQAFHSFSNVANQNWKIACTLWSGTANRFEGEQTIYYVIIFYKLRQITCFFEVLKFIIMLCRDTNALIKIKSYNFETYNRFNTRDHWSRREVRPESQHPEAPWLKLKGTRRAVKKRSIYSIGYIRRRRINKYKAQHE